MMNTNKFLLGGLVATIAIVSVQITNQVQIKELIEKVDTVAMKNTAAVISATESPTTGEVTIIPTAPIDNTCLKTTTTQMFGTSTKQASSQKFVVTPTCDKTTINNLGFGLLSSTKESLSNLQLKEEETGKTYAIQALGIEPYTTSEGKAVFGAAAKVVLNTAGSKNVSRTYSLISSPDVQAYIMASSVTASGNMMTIPYSIYGGGPGSGPQGIPLWWHRIRCKLGLNSNYNFDHCTDAHF